MFGGVFVQESGCFPALDQFGMPAEIGGGCLPEAYLGCISRVFEPVGQAAASFGGTSAVEEFEKGEFTENIEIVGIIMVLFAEFRAGFGPLEPQV